MNRPLATTVLVVIALVLAVATGAAGTAAAADKVELKLRLDEGQTYMLNMTVKQAITQTVMDQEQTIDQTMAFGISLKTTKVDADGAMTIEVKYDSIFFEQDGPMGATTYDSADPPDEIPMQAKGFAALVGRGFTMKITPTAKVLELEGIDKMLDEILEFMELPEGPMLDQMKEGLKQQFGDEALKQQMQQMFATYPDKPVGVGDSWTAEANLTGMMPMVLKNTYKVTAIADGVVTLDGESTVEPIKDAEPVKMGPMTMKIEMSGSQKGTMQIGEKSGLPLKASIDQDLAGTITMTPPGSDEAMSIPMTIKGTITLEGKMADEAKPADDNAKEDAE